MRYGMIPNNEADVARDQIARLALSLCHEAESLRSVDPNVAAAIMAEVNSIVQDFGFYPIDPSDLLPRPGDTPDAATPEVAKVIEFHDPKAPQESIPIRCRRLRKQRRAPDPPEIGLINSERTELELHYLMGLLKTNSQNLNWQRGCRPRKAIKK